MHDTLLHPWVLLAMWSRAFEHRGAGTLLRKPTFGPVNKMPPPVASENSLAREVSPSQAAELNRQGAPEFWAMSPRKQPYFDRGRRRDVRVR